MALHDFLTTKFKLELKLPDKCLQYYEKHADRELMRQKLLFAEETQLESQLV